MPLTISLNNLFVYMQTVYVTLPSLPKFTVCAKRLKQPPQRSFAI